jgi:hypothetical protein
MVTLFFLENLENNGDAFSLTTPTSLIGQDASCPDPVRHRQAGVGINRLSFAHNFP